jgi:hypothetical protein
VFPRAFLAAIAGHLPPKVTLERIIPWVQLLAAIAAGLWALVQYSSSVADRKSDETLKLLSAYSNEAKDAPSLQARFNTLWESELNATKYDPEIVRLTKKYKEAAEVTKKDIGEVEKKAFRAAYVNVSRAHAKKHFAEYSRIYSYMNSVVACATEGRSNRPIVDSVIGPDLFAFLNGACGFFDEYDERWGTDSTGQRIFLYVINQGIEQTLKARGSSPFFCEKFRDQYKLDAFPDFWAQVRAG